MYKGGLIHLLKVSNYAILCSPYRVTLVGMFCFGQIIYMFLKTWLIPINTQLIYKTVCLLRHKNPNTITTELKRILPTKLLGIDFIRESYAVRKELSPVKNVNGPFNFIIQSAVTQNKVCAILWIVIKPLQTKKNLEWSKLKGFADDELIDIQMVKFLSHKIETIVVKGENAPYRIHSDVSGKYLSVLKTLWENEKMLLTSIFSFSHNVFKSLSSYGR